MDRELETYVENVMENSNTEAVFLLAGCSKILRGIADYRGVVDVRGSYGMREASKWIVI